MAGLVAGYFLRTTIVLTLALLAAAAARRRPAALRHFLLSSALVGLLLLPLLSLAPVGWRSPLLPGWMAPAAERGSVSVPDADSTTARLSRSAERPDGAGTDPGSPAVRTIPLPAGSWVSETRPNRSGDMLLAAGRAPISPGATVRTTGAAKAGAARSVDLLVSLLWSAGLAILVLRLAIGLAGAVRLTSEGTPLGGPAWRILLERFLALVPLRRKIRLRSHPLVLVPLTWGWRRPVVLLPSGADSWTEEERSSALFHELSHVKRADFLVMLLVRTSLALFWWNPLCWIVYRELLKEQELACDELVLRAGIRPSSYAASLLAFRRSAGFRWNPSAALLGMLGRSSFQERLAAILKQKLISMEVKMRTKIMLALALVLAVALVGTARPVSGIEAEAAAAVSADTAMSSPAPFDAALADFGAAGAQTGTAAQEKEQEKVKAAEKAKEAEKAEKAAQEKAAGAKTIIVKPVAAAGKPFEVVITEGGEVRTLVLEKPLTITKSKDGDAIILTVDGKDVEILKGEPLRLEIKGGGLQIVGGGKDWKLARELGESGEFKLVKEAGGEGKMVVFYGTAEPKVAVEVSPEVFVKVRKDVREGEKWVQAAPPEEAQKVVVKERRPEIAWTVKEGGAAPAFSIGIGSAEMLEKIQALQEQVQAIKAKKMDIATLEESLKKLAAELQAKEEKLKELKIKLDKAPEEVAWAKAARAGVALSEGKAGVWVLEKDKVAQTEKIKVVTESGDKSDGAISLIFTSQEGGEAGQAAFERAIAALKKDLPEGYKLAEQKYDAENGTMTFKISAPEGKKTDEKIVRKILGVVRDAIKTKE
jgi:beta-lactamase regulating signal transducer with metallopeptidase domain